MSEYTDNRTVEIADWLYAAYGTDSGCLFGFTPDQKTVVVTIIRLVLEEEERKRGEVKR